jgi:hypothetical protein
MPATMGPADGTQHALTPKGYVADPRDAPPGSRPYYSFIADGDYARPAYAAPADGTLVSTALTADGYVADPSGGALASQPYHAMPAAGDYARPVHPAPGEGARPQDASFTADGYVAELPGAPPPGYASVSPASATANYALFYNPVAAAP